MFGRKRGHDQVKWHCHTKVEKYLGDDLSADPYEVVEREGNLLVIGGASALWERLIGTSLTAYDNTNAYISVGDSSTAAADTQTELQAATNRVRKGMDATYPQHTDTTGTAGSKSITYKSTFTTSDANYAWQEWGIFNSAGTGGPPTTGGRMLNRKVESLGTKTSASTWVITVTLSLA